MKPKKGVTAKHNQVDVLGSFEELLRVGYRTKGGDYKEAWVLASCIDEV